ncbi:MAG TPA: hypothetical protein VH370_09495 [Humisphaera sp.]|jgi:hypothetical protein|nr:hypothetical protein [Humisphaera sp.]
MAKRAFFVVGPESSGNRYVTECFVNAGCFGDFQHEQRLDNDEGFDEATDTVVFRRSVPHGPNFSWPELSYELFRSQERGYHDVKVLALLRNQFCTIESHLNGNKFDGNDKHSRTAAEAERKIVGAMFRIASFIMENRLPCYYMTYESLAQPEFLSAVLFDWGLDGSKVKKFEDGNERHLNKLRAPLDRKENRLMTAASSFSAVPIEP